MFFLLMRLYHQIRLLTKPQMWPVANSIPGRLLCLIALAQLQLQIVVILASKTVVIHAKTIARIAAAKTIVWVTVAQLRIV
jgi:hypothetical protein